MKPAARRFQALLSKFKVQSSRFKVFLIPAGRFLRGVAWVVSGISGGLCACAIIGFGLGLILAGCNAAVNLGTDPQLRTPNPQLRTP